MRLNAALGYTLSVPHTHIIPNAALEYEMYIAESKIRNLQNIEANIKLCVM
jgi:hypothetical protein